MMRRFLVLVGLVSILIGLVVASGCSTSKSPVTPQPIARIRVVHASTDFGDVDIYLGNDTTPWFAGLQYGQASTYLSGNPRVLTLVFRPAGSAATSEPLFTSDELTLASGASKTAVAAGLAASSDPADAFRLLVLGDKWQAHGTGESLVRIVHAGADGPAVSVAVEGDDALIDNLARFAHSIFGGQPYAPGETQDVAVRGPVGAKSFRVPPLDAGSDYYFIVTGLVASNGADALTLIPVGPGGAVTLAASGPRNLRVVHASHDLGPVDAYAVNGLGAGIQRLSMQEDFAQGQVTSYGWMPAHVVIEFYTPDADPAVTAPLFSGMVHAATDPATTTAIVSGARYAFSNRNALQFMVLPDEFDDVPEAGTSMVRIVHAALDGSIASFDIGDDGTDEAVLDEYTASAAGGMAVAAGAPLTIVVRAHSEIEGIFTTPAYAEGVDHYLIFAHQPGGPPAYFPVYSLLSVTATESLGFVEAESGI